MAQPSRNGKSAAGQYSADASRTPSQYSYSPDGSAPIGSSSSGSRSSTSPPMGFRPCGRWRERSFNGGWGRPPYGHLFWPFPAPPPPFSPHGFPHPYADPVGFYGFPPPPPRRNGVYFRGQPPRNGEHYRGGPPAAPRNGVYFSGRAPPPPHNGQISSVPPAAPPPHNGQNSSVPPATPPPHNGQNSSVPPAAPPTHNGQNSNVPPAAPPPHNGQNSSVPPAAPPRNGERSIEPAAAAPPPNGENFGAPEAAATAAAPAEAPAAPPPIDDLREKLTRQLDFYFSADNLSTDDYLRSKMDNQGWVPVSVILTFARVMALTDDGELVMEAARACSMVEVQEDSMRRRENWKKWSTLRNVPRALLPSYQRNPALLNDEQAAANPNDAPLP